MFTNINAASHAEHVRACFPFVGDLNGHHQEWLGSTTTNCHGVVAFDFATCLVVIGCRHGPCTWSRDLMTAVSDLVLVAVVAPIANLITHLCRRLFFSEIPI